MALNGDTALIGELPSSLSGAAYVFVRNGTVWSQQQKLTPSDGAYGAQFAFTVSLNADTAVIGAYNKTINGHSGGGAAYVFVRNGTVWTQQQELLPSDLVESDHFGYSVAINGDTAIVGAFNKNIGTSSSEGAAYVFRYQARD